MTNGRPSFHPSFLIFCIAIFSAFALNLRAQDEGAFELQRVPGDEDAFRNFELEMEPQVASRINETSFLDKVEIFENVGYVHVRIYKDAWAVNFSKQFATASIMLAGRAIAWDAFYISSGKPQWDGGSWTRPGHFTVHRREAYNYVSGKGDPMPYALFFNGGIATHNGYVTGGIASHGCIRVPDVYNLKRLTGKSLSTRTLADRLSYNKARLLNWAHKQYGSKFLISIYGNNDRQYSYMELGKTTVKGKNYLTQDGAIIQGEKDTETISRRLRNPVRNYHTGFEDYVDDL